MRSIVSALVLVAAVSMPAYAQQRAFRGIFGGADTLTRRAQSLDLSGSLTAGFDATPRFDNEPADKRKTPAGQNANGDVSLGYSRRWTDASFSANGGASLRYYPKLEDRNLISSYAAGIGFDAPLGRRTTVSASQTAGFSPFYQAGLFGGLPGLGLGGAALPVPETGLEFALRPADTWRYASSINLNRQFSPRTTADLFYDYAGTTFSSASLSRYEMRDSRVGGAVNHKLGQYLGVRLGYAYRRSGYGTSNGQAPYRTHDIDAGITYARSLSISRKTTVAFGTGSTIVSTQPNLSAISAKETRFFVLGNAVLTREIARTWSASAGYDRSVAFDQGLGQPVTRDAWLASINGLISRRIDVSAQARYSRGLVGLTKAGDNQYGTWTGSVNVRSALTRNLALTATYFYYRYEFGSAVQLPLGLATRLDRQGVRAGLSVWLPLL